MSSKKITDLAYMAGIIDGEGTISCYWYETNSTFAPVVCVVNTDKRLMTWIVRNFGGQYRISKPASVGKKTVYEWKLLANDRISFLCDIIPYLRLKRRQARTTLKLCRMLANKDTWSIPKEERETRLSLVHKLKELNR